MTDTGFQVVITLNSKYDSTVVYEALTVLPDTVGVQRELVQGQSLVVFFPYWKLATIDTVKVSIARQGKFGRFVADEWDDTLDFDYTVFFPIDTNHIDAVDTNHVDTVDTNHVDTVTNNSAPVIQAITFVPEKVLAGQSCIIKCTAVDSDNDKLTYEWESVGNIAGSGSSVIYTPNSCCGNPMINIIVKDGRGKSIDSIFAVPFSYDE
jgi:hypothetical protein